MKRMGTRMYEVECAVGQADESGMTERNCFCCKLQSFNGCGRPQVFNAGFLIKIKSL